MHYWLYFSLEKFSSHKTMYQLPPNSTTIPFNTELCTFPKALTYCG